MPAVNWRVMVAKAASEHVGTKCFLSELSLIFMHIRYDDAHVIAHARVHSSACPHTCLAFVHAYA